MREREEKHETYKSEKEQHVKIGQGERQQKKNGGREGIREKCLNN